MIAPLRFARLPPCSVHYFVLRQEEEDQISMTWNDPFNNAYKKLFFNKAGTKLLGGILVGDASDYTTLLVSVVCACICGVLSLIH